MSSYTVTWTVTIDADSQQDAVNKAFEIFNRGDNEDPHLEFQVSPTAITLEPELDW